MGLDQSTSMPNSGVLGFAQLKGYISKFNRKKKCDLVGEGKEKSRMNREREGKTNCTYVHYFLKNAKKKPLKPLQWETKTIVFENAWMESKSLFYRYCRTYPTTMFLILLVYLFYFGFFFFSRANRPLTFELSSLLTSIVTHGLIVNKSPTSHVCMFDCPLGSIWTVHQRSSPPAANL